MEKKIIYIHYAFWRYFFLAMDIMMLICTVATFCVTLRLDILGLLLLLLIIFAVPVYFVWSAAIIIDREKNTLYIQTHDNFFKKFIVSLDDIAEICVNQRGVNYEIRITDKRGHIEFKNCGGINDKKYSFLAAERRYKKVRAQLEEELPDLMAK